jgi:hypothetical protein
MLYTIILGIGGVIRRYNWTLIKEKDISKLFLCFYPHLLP